MQLPAHSNTYKVPVMPESKEQFPLRQARMKRRTSYQLQKQFLCWKSIFRLLGKIAELEHLLWKMPLEIYLNLKRPDFKTRKKTTTTTTTIQFLHNDKLCDYCNCISKYCQMCIKTEQKLTKNDTFLLVQLPQKIRQIASSDLNFQG